MDLFNVGNVVTDQYGVRIAFKCAGAFAPANDADILAGAQEIVAMKINPATQSTATLTNAQGDALELTSADYGEFTKQCAWCKLVLTDDGWEKVTPPEGRWISHGLCPVCSAKLDGGMVWDGQGWREEGGEE